MTENLFGKTLSALIASKHGSSREFSQVCGVDFSTISRLVSGDRRCSHEMLKALCSHISHESLERYELLLAHLYDEAVASGLDVSRLSLRHLNGVNLNELDLSPEMNGQLGIIARAATKIPEVAESIESLSGMICRYEALNADSAIRAAGAEEQRRANSKKLRGSSKRKIDQSIVARGKRVEEVRPQHAKSSL